MFRLGDFISPQRRPGFVSSRAPHRNVKAVLVESVTELRKSLGTEISQLPRTHLMPRPLNVHDANFNAQREMRESCPGSQADQLHRNSEFRNHFSSLLEIRSQNDLKLLQDAHDKRVRVKALGPTPGEAQEKSMLPKLRFKFDSSSEIFLGMASPPKKTLKLWRSALRKSQNKFHRPPFMYWMYTSDGKKKNSSKTFDSYMSAATTEELAWQRDQAQKSAWSGEIMPDSLVWNFAFLAGGELNRNVLSEKLIRLRKLFSLKYET